MEHDLGGTAGGSLVLEFLGLPGSGKSRLSQMVAGELRSRGVAVSEPTFTISTTRPVTSRLARKLRYALDGGRGIPTNGHYWTRWILASRQRELADLGRHSLNWYYVVGMMRRCGAVPGVHVFDQGLFQALWSFGYGASAPTAAMADGTALRHNMAAVLPPRLVVVRLEVSRPVIVERLTERINGEWRSGRSRLERHLRTGTVEPALARAASALQQIDRLACELEQRQRITLVQVDNEDLAALHTNAAALADTITDLLGVPAA
ncbi:MAG TPA: hypothetical protein VFS44_03290 [Gemmatimonadaceae bacterium]|nr:hypothetical protein [Gemmatimonadaceae bacterium]